MTATSQDRTWPLANSLHFLDTQPLDTKFCNHGNMGNSDELDSGSNSSSAMYSVSDICLSGSSSGSDVHADETVTEVQAATDVDDTKVKVASSNLFLPPSVVRHNSIGTLSLQSDNELNCSTLHFSACKPLTFDCLSTEWKDCETSNPTANTSPPQTFSIYQNEFDVVSMKQKLEAQKEYVVGSFQKPPRLPQASSTLPKYPCVKKRHNLKMKERLLRIRKAARHFLSSKIFKRQPGVQRCEIQLYGFDDSVEQLILVVSQRDSSNESFYMSLPSVTEMNRVTVPQFLLPSRPGEIITVSMYGVTGQNNEHLPSFSEVLLSGMCTVQSGSVLLMGRLELQPHRPCLSLMCHNKAMQSCGSKLMMTESDPSTYSFSTTPTPVAQNFTELCVLQAAEPFREHFALLTSTCDHPASFQVLLLPGKYYAACSYRLTGGPVSGTFSGVSATPKTFFKTYMNKASIMDRKQSAAELAEPEGGVHKEPRVLPSLTLLKPPEADLRDLMAILCTGQADAPINVKPILSDFGIEEEGLYFCTWDLETLPANQCMTKTSFAMPDARTGVTSPHLPTRNRERLLLPSLSLFNMSTRLYFADYWNRYDKYYVMLVLCTKKSPCQQVCKQHFCKLNPYNNPFFLRKRHFEPEPSVAVYASTNVNVVIIFSNSANIRQMVSLCSEAVYSSKVQMMGN